MSRNMGLREVINQDRAKEFLKSSIALDRVANGYLFYGPRGIGKSTTALAFAQGLNCEREDSEGCGECTSCRKIARFLHPDVTFIFPTSSKKEHEEILSTLEARAKDEFFVHSFPQAASIKIRAIQDLRMDLAVGVREGRRRVIILAYAERMTTEASNCLLRMLEEPPTGVTFVLTAPSRHVLLTTIVSRCQAVRFVPLAAREVEKILLEKVIDSEVEARIAARLCDGSLSTALDLVEKNGVESEEPRGVLGYREESLDYLRKIGTGEPKEILTVAEGLAAHRDRERVRRFVRLSLLWLRDLLLVKHGAGEADVANQDMLDALKEEAGAVELAELRKRIEILDGIVASMERHVDLSLLLSSSFLRLAGIVEDTGQPFGTERNIDAR
jgi:DNA polymerase-3 subunit delta'